MYVATSTASGLYEREDIEKLFEYCQRASYQELIILCFGRTTHLKSHDKFLQKRTRRTCTIGCTMVWPFGP